MIRAANTLTITIDTKDVAPKPNDEDILTPHFYEIIKHHKQNYNSLGMHHSKQQNK